MNEANQPLSGLQLQQIQKQMAQAFSATMEKMELRKWAVEKALASDGPGQLMQRADDIYNFVTAPVAEIKITISE